MRSKKGFTLVELLIVIAILAILATVSIIGYTSFIDKANQSVDEQAVAQINTVLKASEVDGKPQTLGEVKIILDENDINVNGLVPITKGYAFYWDKSENELLLVGTNEDVEDGWVLVNSNEYGEIVKADEASDIASAISASVETPALIKLDVDMSVSSQNMTFEDAPDIHGNNVGRTKAYTVSNGQTVILDLNGQTLDTDATYLFQVTEGGTLTIKNGKIKGHRAIDCRGGVVSLENVEIESDDGGAVFVVGFAEVSIVDCKITTTGYYALTANSNSDSSDGSRFYVKNSELTGNYHGIYISTNSIVLIADSKVSGKEYGADLHGCRATLKNSTFSGGTGDLKLGAGGSGYANIGIYDCENVTAGRVHKYEGASSATVKITGIEYTDYPNK